MSPENAEVVRRAGDALNRRDLDAFVALLSPYVEWEESGDVLPGLRGFHRGAQAVRKWFDEAILEAWESLHSEPEEITEASDGRVFAQSRATARGRASGVEVELRFWQVFWLADGKIVRRRLFRTRDAALVAAGLSD